MEGQLQWDGLVLPIAEVSWEKVLATAERLQGLEIDEEFFVTYKDEEGDVINVKNEVDMAEAIRWAREQGVPNLCLEVPFSSVESDSDESWTEIDNGSPRGNKVVVPTERPLDLNDDTQESLPAADMASVQHAEGSVEDEEKHQPEEEGLSQSEHTQGHAEREQAVEDELSQTELAGEPAESDQTAHASDDDEGSPLLVSSVPGNVTPTAVVQVTPIAEAFQAQLEATVATPIPFIFEVPVSTAPASVDAEIAQTSSVNIDNFVGMLYSVNELPSDDEVADRDLLMKFFSSIEGINALIAFASNEAVQNGMMAVAQAERTLPGSALKAASTQLIKTLYKNPSLFEHLNRIPDLETMLPRLLRKLKVNTKSLEVKPTSPVPVPTHASVACDGCDSNEEQKRLSIEAGHRNEDGEIVGVRYKSAVLPNYDLCEICEASRLYQVHAGPFLKIIDPATAPEIILCALPGATAGMMSQADSLDWRNPVAREFLDFVQSRRQRAFPQQRSVSQQQSPAVSAAVGTSPKPVESAGANPSAAPVAASIVVSGMASASANSEPVQITVRPELRCKHLLQRFETPHGSFSCDICMKKQPSKSVMHGCRSCNFDICAQCNTQHGFVPSPPAEASAPVVAIAPPAPPQAKFVSDVTLADGCVVRTGERLNKTWRVRNSGSERWPAGTRIGHVGGDAFGGPVTGVEVPLAAPGEAVNVSVPLVMPTQPGRYTSYWRMMTPHPQSAKFGHRFWVTVNVVPSAPQAVSAPIWQPRAFPGQIIRPPPPPTVNLSGFTVPVPPTAPVPPSPPMFGFVAGSPMVPSRPPFTRPPPPPPVQSEEPVVVPELEMAVAQITDFGFTDIDKIVKILKEVNGDTSAAIDKLLEDA
jgi:hypothetical protein